MDYSKADLKLLEEKEIKKSDIERQLINFEKGFRYVQLTKPATIGDGILRIDLEKEDFFSSLYENLRPNLKTIKMVPASGSATRMFKDLFQFIEVYQDTEEDFLTLMQSKKQDNMFHFFSNLEKYPFYSHLEDILWHKKKDLKKMLAKREYKEILTFILDKKGLNYGNTPKGLVDFHVYQDFTRTAFDEHVIESALYCNNGQTATLHFTVSEEHLPLFEKRLKKISKAFERGAKNMERIILNRIAWGEC